MSLPDMMKSNLIYTQRARCGYALLIVLLTSGTIVALTISDSSTLAAPPQSAHTTVLEYAESDNGNGTKSIAPVAASTWQVRGMGGGGGLVYAAISPHNSQEMYVATDMSAVFHTTDFGQNWQTIPFSQLAGTADADVRFTSDPNVLYAIHWYDPWWVKQIPVRSDDGGQTFHPLPATPPVPDDNFAARLFTDPNHTERLVIGYESAVYFSGDGGATYQLVAEYDGSSTYAIRLAGVHWDGETIIVATNQGLFRSTNEGESFAAYPLSGIPDGEGIANFAAAQSGEQSRFLAVTVSQADIEPGMETPENPTRLFRLDNGGTWEELLLPLPQDIPFFIESFAGDLDTFYLAGAAWRDDALVPGVWRSDDGGDSWQSLFNTENNQNIATGWMGDEAEIHWWWDGTAFGFDADPTNPDRLVMSSNWVWTSEDGGQSWQAAFVQAEDRNPPGSLVDPTAAYQTTGIDPTTCYWLHWVDGNTVMAAFTDISSKRSTDGGLHWQNGNEIGLPFNTVYHLVEGENGRLYAAVSDVHDMYLEPQDSSLDQSSRGGIYYSDDDGASWDELVNFAAPVVWLALDPNNSERLYASVVHNKQGGIYVTDNLSDGTSANFTPLPAPARTQKRPFNIRILNDSTLVTSWSVRTEAGTLLSKGETFTESSGIFVSRDGGLTWSDRSHPNMRIWTMDVVIDPHDAAQNSWYAAVRSHQSDKQPKLSDTGGLYRTTDRGQTWTRIIDHLQAPRVHSITIHPEQPDTAYVTTEGDGLLLTSNLTAATPLWKLDSTYPFRAPVRVFFNPYNESEIWTTTYGNGMLMRTLSAQNKLFLPAVIRE